MKMKKVVIGLAVCVGLGIVFSPSADAQGCYGPGCGGSSGTIAAGTTATSGFATPGLVGSSSNLVTAYTLSGTGTVIPTTTAPTFAGTVSFTGNVLQSSAGSPLLEVNTSSASGISSIAAEYSTLLYSSLNAYGTSVAGTRGGVAKAGLSALEANGASVTGFAAGTVNATPLTLFTTDLSRISIAANGATTIGTSALGTSVVPLTLTPGTGSTANLLNLTNSAGTVLSAIDLAGNLGIGNAAPIAKLSVGPVLSATHTNGVGAEIASPFQAVDYGQLILSSTDTQAADKGGKLIFGGKYVSTTTDGSWAGIGGFKENSTSGQYGGYMAFFTRAHGSSQSEKLRITSAGAFEFTGGALMRSLTYASGSDVGLTVQGSLTGNIQNWKNSASTVLGYVDSTGNHVISANAPNKGFIVNSTSGAGIYDFAAQGLYINGLGANKIIIGNDITLADDMVPSSPGNQSFGLTANRFGAGFFLGLDVTNNLTLGSATILNEETTATLQLGSDVNGSAVNQTFKAHDGITGTDISGANLTIAAGRGTGTGAGGSLIFQTAPVLTTGTTAQTLATVLTLPKSGGVQVATGTKPACASGIRGTIYYVAGGAGVLDTLEVCRKDAADAYAWVTLF